MNWTYKNTTENYRDSYLMNKGLQCRYMRLITTWFGTFLLDDDGQVVEKNIFPKDAGEVAARLRTIETGEILPEEEELVGGRSVIVREKRLELLGEVMSFEEPELSPGDYGFPQALLGQAMVLLGKEKVKVSATPDEQLLQAIRAIDDLTKTINLMTERLHEWHGINFPELAKLVPEIKYPELISKFGDRSAMIESGEVIIDDSMGSDITPQDSKALKLLAGSILATVKAKKEMEEYVQARMEDVAKNTAHVAGPLIGARLISLAGGLERLSKLPSSTVQLLGAEKAMFKHLKDKARPPKHGVIFQHPIIHRAPPWQRGKIARAFASKISIATKVDRHGDRFIGDELEEALARRLKEIQRKYPNPPKGKKGRGK
jgi:nucleolar protein 56